MQNTTLMPFSHIYGSKRFVTLERQLNEEFNLVSLLKLTKIEGRKFCVSHFLSSMLLLLG